MKKKMKMMMKRMKMKKKRITTRSRRCLKAFRIPEASPAISRKRERERKKGRIKVKGAWRKKRINAQREKNK